MGATGNKTIIARSLAAAFAGGLALAALPSFAQEVQVVEVTAQSRRQSANEVPISLQVVTMKDIESVGAKDLSGLNGYIPGLVVDGGEPTQPSFGIRGVHPGDFGIATDSPVGIYVDGVYAGKTGGALMNFVDVQRIEVVKGPQGTLFGRNSAAGAISITTNAPTNYVEANVHAKFGKYGRRDMDGMVNMPYSKTGALRFVAVSAQSDGWVTNTATGRKMGDDKDWATRLSVKDSIGDAKLNFMWEHEKLDQSGRPAFGVVKDPSMPLAGYRGVYDATYLKNFVDPRKVKLENDTQGEETRTFDGATLRIEAPIGGVSFTSITGYRKFKTTNFTDNDGTQRSTLKLATQDAKDARSWQQEFKLSSRNEQVDWIAGVSFYDNKEWQEAGAYVNTGTLDTLALFAGGAPSFSNLFGMLGAAGVPGVNGSTVFAWNESHFSDVRTKASSVYGDVIWHLNPATSLTAGVRWSKDQKTMTWHVPGRSSKEFDALITMVGPMLGGLTPAAFPSNVIFDAAAKLANKPVSRTKDWTDVSPRLVLDHKVDKDTLLFASISKGYQAGGFNVFTPPNPAATNPADRDPSFSPEKMTNLEVGLKMVFPQMNATLNASVFNYKFKNLQDIKLYSVGTIPTYNVISSDQKATGIDVDGRIKLNRNVTLFGGFEVIDQTYTRYQRFDGSGKVILDLGGQPVGTPRFTGMGGVAVNWGAMGGHMSWTFQGTHSSETRCNKDTGDVGCLRGYAFNTGEAVTKFDTRLGWDNADRSFGVGLIVNNVFDKRYVTSLGGQTKEFGMPYASITPPRFIGVEFKASL